VYDHNCVWHDTAPTYWSRIVLAICWSRMMLAICWSVYVGVYDKRVYAVYDTAPTYCQHIDNCSVATYIWQHIYIYIYDMNMSIVPLRTIIYGMYMSLVLLRIYLCLQYVSNIMPTHSQLLYYDIYMTTYIYISIWHEHVYCAITHIFTFILRLQHIANILSTVLSRHIYI